MKTNGFMRIFTVVSLLMLCMLCVCSATVSVDNVTSVVGSQAKLTANVTDIEATSYQWYICDDAEGTNPEAIGGAATATYTTPNLNTVGNTYYMVKVNNTESAVATVTAIMPTEPVVLKFNNEQDLESWNAGTDTKRLVNIDGKTAFAYTAWSDDAHTNFNKNISQYNDFYLQGYPYFVVSASYPDHTTNTFDIYIGADGYDPDYRKEHYNFNFSISGIRIAVNKGFCKTVISAKDGSFKSYDAQGNVVASGKGSADGFKDYTTLIGKLATFRLDVSNNNKGKDAYIEYFGFFPTEEMAVAYNGEMPYDNDMNSVIEALDTANENSDMDIPYEYAATEATADEYIAERIPELAADAIEAVNAKGIETVNIEIISSKYIPAENYWEDGEYTFTVSFLVGDKVFRRSDCKKTYTVALKAKEIGNVFIPDVNVAIGATATLTPILFNDTVATSYQWYTCKDTEGTGSVAIEGATDATYTTPNLNEFGSYYYKVVVNGTDEAVVAVSVGMPTKPVVFMFNNEYDLANWNAGTDTKRLVNIDGKTAFAYTAWSDDAHTNFNKNISQYNDFYLQGYPYFVVSASYPNHETNSFDIYIGADGYDPDYRKEHYDFNFSISGIRLAVNKGFCKTVISAKDGSFKSYDAKGNVVASGKGSADGFKDYTTLIGKLATFRLDVSNGNKGKDAYIEYFGFFPTEEMAVAYNGEMPEDDSARLLTDALEEAEAAGGLSMIFANAENETMVRENAAKAVESLTAETITSLKEKYNTVEFTVGDATYSRTSPYGRGEYKFEAKALVGDKPFGRSLVSTDVTMELKGKPDPVIMTFDTEAKVKGATTSGHTSKTFVEKGTVLEGKTEAEDRSYMRIYHKGLASGDVQIFYSNFYDQTGKTFNFQDYPYMKISYRRDVKYVSGKDAIMVYAGIDNSPSFFIYPTGNNTAPYWEQLVVDMRKPNVSRGITFYQEAAGTTSYGTLSSSSKTKWETTYVGEDTTPVEIRLSRYGTEPRTIDYEYIAFFSSLDEAKMYPERLPENASYDVENLEKKNSFRAGEGVVTKAEAQEAAERYLKDFVFATNYNIDHENAVFTPPSSKAEGTYVFDVWFGTERKEEFTVTVTMTLDSLPKPVIMFADSNTVFGTLSGDNVKLKLEDGVVKMNVSKPANDDGFFLLTKYPGTMERFNVNTLPYLKMRYSISGISKDINGNPVRTSDVQAQIFTWFTTSYKTIPYKSFYPYGGSFEDGDEIEIIVDMSYVTPEMKNQDMVWVRNITKGETEYSVVRLAAYRNEDNGDTSLAHRDENTKYTQVRHNLARQANLKRYAEFYYAGYFASLDEAMAFDSDVAAKEKLEAAEVKLRALSDIDVEIPWNKVAMEKTEVPDSKATFNADGSFDVSGVKTKTVSAMIGLKAWAENYIGADGVVEITDYTAPTETQKGSITFNMTLESGYQSKTIENVTATVSEKPTGYKIWRFNDPDVVSKISYKADKNWAKIEDNLLKFDHKDAVDGSNYRITLEPSDFGQETFKFEDYSYVLMKYKRIGDISPCHFIFSNKDGKTETLSNIGWGWFSDDWYYTLFDSNIRDIVTPQGYNYNIDRENLEERTYCTSYSAPTAAAFTGEVSSITFDFGGRWYADRWMELEFIAFFPSMADAREYVENIEAKEDLASDTAAELKYYTADTVSYLDGNTQNAAEAKAFAIIDDMVSANNVEIAVNTVSYTAPVQDTQDGSYVFTASVTKNGENVYTTGNITLTIGNAVDNSAVAYKFTNPRFIRTIEGATDEYDFVGMTLKNNYFVLEVGADKPNVMSGVYNILKLDATFDGGFTAIINGNEEIVYQGNADGAVYLELGKFAGNIDTLKVQFNNEGAKVRALGFFADNAAAQAYDFDAVPEALITTANNFKGSHNYAHANAKTLANVKAHTKAVYLEQKIQNKDVTVADVKYANYIPSTETEFGYTDITVTLAYGNETETYYKAVTFKATLAKDAEVVKATPKSIGHEFLGWDTITATKNFANAPQTVEFSIMVSEKTIGKESMNILKSGSTSIALVNGKITVNSSLTASTALEADTWTHIAITSDGKIYINGALNASASSVSFSANAPVIGDKFVGHLRDVRFWNDIRTAQEIAANKDIRTDSDGLLANWMLTADSYEWLEYRDESEYANTAIFKSTGWYKMEAGLQGDYSMIHFGDTQSYFQIEPRSFKRIPDMFEWIGNNVDKYNIAHVSILGDATQTNTMFEWAVVREAHDFIEGKTTYHLPLGNHDYPNPSHGVGAEIRDTTHFRNTFTYDDYVATYGPDGMNTFGGTFRDEKELTNMYNLVSAGGNDYIFFAIEFAPRQIVLDWVGEVLTQYPDRQAIISTHSYFSTDGTLTKNNTNYPEFADGIMGYDIYHDFITKYPNIILVTCGHSQGDDSKQQPHQRGSSYKDSPTADDFGNDVVQILSDASAYALNYPDGETYDFGSSGANSTAFGADEGLIFIMMFKDGGRTMHTYVYSPLHDSFFRSVNEQTHTIKEIKTQPSLNVVGTELREQTTQETLGMRFKMTLSKSFANFEDEVKVQGYGVVVVPEDVMEEGMEVTADMLKGTENAKYVKVEECSDTIFYEDDERTDFTVVIHSIPTNDGGEAYARQFKARAYVDYTVNGGEVQRLYSFKTLTCSMNSLVND